MNKFYLTTAIPYINGTAHIGHLLEYFQADTIRRYHDLIGDETLLLSGADENALKNVQAAKKENLPIEKFLNKYSHYWEDLYNFVGVKLDVFQRGSDKEKHWKGVQKFWELVQKNGDIYKKSYEGLYCVGCESFKSPEELVDNLCPIHQTKPEQIKEDNYFFKLSKYQDNLIQLIESGELKITPENKKTEALSFIKQGLEDFSVSRTKDRAKGVGVPVPDDPDQIMYVWFDALNIYMTGIGYGWDEKKWEKWWPADLHVVGKDINRFHTVYWPAMLLSAGLPLPKQIFIHGFVNASGGEKFSKSLGNGIDPYEHIKTYGLESTRYFLLSQMPLDSDMNFDLQRFKEIYNADLANGLGNLVARVAKLAEQNNITAAELLKEFDPEMTKFLEQFNFSAALNHIWDEIQKADKKINEEKPWELEGEKLKTILEDLIKRIHHIAYNLQPFLPETSEKILNQFSSEIKSSAPLFPRI